MHSLQLYGIRKNYTEACVNGNYNNIPPLDFASSVTCVEAELALSSDSVCSDAIENGDKDTYCSGTCRVLGNLVASSCGNSVRIK